MNILIVLTSHDQLGDPGEKTGFRLEEFAAPYYVLKDVGAKVTLASPKGGEPPRAASNCSTKSGRRLVGRGMRTT